MEGKNTKPVPGKPVKETEENTFAVKLGRCVGSIMAYTVAGCGVAIIVGITVKILQWMLF
jgi:hypothetical protein